jgi:CheY-like chemotaxis protein
VPRVLVVDDNNDAATTLAALLKRAGHQTRIAHSGFEAIEVARAFEPEAIILDIGLPRMDGFETCRRIREAPNPARPLVVALTGWSGEQTRARAKQAGFDAHLVKPVNPLELLAMLDGDLWMTNARAANAVAQAIAAAAPERLVYPVEANEVFLKMSGDEAAGLRAQGFDFYDWGEGEIRLVAAWDQQGSDAVDRLVKAIAAL